MKNCVFLFVSASFVVTLHCENEMRRIHGKKATKTTAYRHTDCILAAAPYVLDLLKPLPINRSAIEIELGLATQHKQHIRFKNSGDKQKIELLFVGRVIRTKGVRDGIRAVAKMETRDQVRFTIIGDGGLFLRTHRYLDNAFIRLKRNIRHRHRCGAIPTIA